MWIFWRMELTAPQEGQPTAPGQLSGHPAWTSLGESLQQSVASDLGSRTGQHSSFESVGWKTWTWHHTDASTSSLLAAERTHQRQEPCFDLPWDGQRSSLVALCQRLKIPELATEAFIGHVAKGDLVWQATGNQLAADMVSASLARTWYVVPWAEDLCSPQTGSRPGDPLADILFSCVMASILDRIQLLMEEMNLLEPCEDSDLLSTQMVTWVDDVAIGLMSSADKLCHNTIAAFHVIQQVFTEYGMTMSLGVGKSATILRFAGKGAVRARQACESTYAQHLPVLCEYGPIIQVPIVSHYKHLGGFLQRNGALLAEIKIRGAQALQRIAPLRSMLKDERLDIEQRRLLVKSIAMPIITLHCGAWSNLGKGDFQAWSGALFRLYSILQTRQDPGVHKAITFYQAANSAQCPMPVELLHINKLRLLFQIMEHGDEAMFSAVVWNWKIAQEDSWLAGAFRSLRWMEEQCGSSCAVEHCWGLHDIHAWGAIKPMVRSLKKNFKNAEKAHLLRVRNMSELQTVDKFQKDLLVEMGWTSPHMEDEVDPLDKTFTCTTCSKAFTTAAGLSVHENKVHGRSVAVRRFVKGGACWACQKFFHTRGRVVQHLHYGKSGCWITLLRWLVPFSVEDSLALDEEACKLGEAWHHQGLRAHDKDLQWRWCTPEESVPLLQERMDKSQVPQCLPTEEEIQAWQELGLLPPGQGGKEITVRKQREWHVFNSVEDPSVLEAQAMKDAGWWNSDYSWVPLPLKLNARFYLIFFSGHRRINDIPSWIQWTSDIVPVCIDTAISKEKGNMFQIGFWTHLVMSGLVIGGHGGPPAKHQFHCETPNILGGCQTSNLETYDSASQAQSWCWGLWPCSCWSTTWVVASPWSAREALDRSRGPGEFGDPASSSAFWCSLESALYLSYKVHWARHIQNLQSSCRGACHTLHSQSMGLIAHPGSVQRSWEDILKLKVPGVQPKRRLTQENCARSLQGKWHGLPANLLEKIMKQTFLAWIRCLKPWLIAGILTPWINVQCLATFRRTLSFEVGEPPTQNVWRTGPTSIFSASSN